MEDLANRIPRIPPTQLVDRSYAAYIKQSRLASRIPPTQLVVRSYAAYIKQSQQRSNPTNCSWCDSGEAISSVAIRLDMNEPPTAVGGIREKRAAACHVGWI